MEKAICLTMLFMYILVVSTACSHTPEVLQEENTASEKTEEVQQEGAAEDGNIIEGEYVEVRVREEGEPVTTQDPFDMIAQAQAAKDSGQNVNIHIS